MARSSPRSALGDAVAETQPSGGAGIARPELIETVIDAESGGRHLAGRLRFLVVNVAVLWSVFQLWTASPLSFWIAGEFPRLSWLVFNDTDVRAIHLAFAGFLFYLSFPLRKKS